MKKLLIPAGLILLIMVFVSCSGKSISVEIENKYGIAYNPVRQKIHMVPVDASMKFIEDTPGERYIFSKQHEPDVKSPGYLRKILTIDPVTKNLTRENDCFINPEEKLYLVFDHHYAANHTYINLQVINDENSSNPSTELELPEADSILQSWGVAISTPALNKN